MDLLVWSVRSWSRRRRWIGTFYACCAFGKDSEGGRRKQNLAVHPELPLCHWWCPCRFFKYPIFLLAVGQGTGRCLKILNSLFSLSRTVITLGHHRSEVLEKIFPFFRICSFYRPKISISRYIFAQPRLLLFCFCFAFVLKHKYILDVLSLLSIGLVDL